MRLVLKFWWLAVLPAASSALLSSAGGWKSATLALAVLLLIAGVFRPRLAEPCSTVAAGLLLSLLLALAGHLLADDFALRYVWLYSAPALPWYLKLSNLWGGDEGTLLFMASLAGVGARLLVPAGGWTSSGALLVTAGLTVGTLIWTPFAPTARRRSWHKRSAEA